MSKPVARLDAVFRCVACGVEERGSSGTGHDAVASRFVHTPCAERGHRAHMPPVRLDLVSAVVDVPEGAWTWAEGWKIEALDPLLVGVRSGAGRIERRADGWWLSVEGTRTVSWLDLAAYEGDDPNVARLWMWHWLADERQHEAESARRRHEMEELFRRALGGAL